MKKTVYLLHPEIKYKTFKKLNDKLVKDDGPAPKNIDKILWRMLRDKQILLWFAEDMKNDMGIGLELPDRYKNWQIKIINSKS